MPWQKLAITVPTALTPWQTAGGAPRLAGVSSFGLSGSNAHVIVEEAPPLHPQQAIDRPERSHHLLPLSAKTSEALQAQVQAYRIYLQDHPHQAWADICHTAATGREHFAHRLALVASANADATQMLHTLAQDFSQATYHHHAGRRPPNVAFLFTGQGAQYGGMGQELYQTEPIFRAIIDRCDVVFQAVLGRSLLELLYPAHEPEYNDLMESHPCGQAANFAIECALAELWRSWGILPDFVLGHSLGDFAAAYAAGVIGLEDGLRLVTKRGQLMETALGSMVSVLAAEADLLPLIADYKDVTIGVINGPTSTVLSGGHASIAKVTAQVQAAGFKTRKLDIPVAAHSPLLDPVLDAFEQAVRKVTLNPPKRKVISSMTGRVVTDELTDPTYWRKHLRNTVRFGDGVATLHEQGVDIFVEIGPGATLLGMTQSIYDLRLKIDEISSPDETVVNRTSKIVNPAMLPSLRKNQSDWQQMLTSLGALYVHGVAIDWEALAQGYHRRKVTLPTYPFQRQRYWVDVPKRRAGGEPLRPLIDQMTRSPLVKAIIFETAVSTETLPFLKDHLVYDTVVSPGACQISMVLSAGELTFAQADGLVLEDIVFPQPFVLPSDGRTHPNETKGQRAQVVLTPMVDGQRYEAQLISLDDDAEFQTHLIGVVAWRDTPLPSPLEIEMLRQQHSRSFDLREFYSDLADTQITLGPSFRWIVALWHPQTSTERDDVPPSSALAQLSCPAVIDAADGYLLHPGLLDACLQVAGTTEVHCRETAEPLLPFAIQSLHLHQSATGAAWWCHATKIDSNKWDIALMDESGALVATIAGFEMRAASPSAVQHKDIWRRWLYQVAWRATPQAPISPQAQLLAGGRWLILADQSGVGMTLATRLQEQGAKPVLVYADTTVGEMCHGPTLAETAIAHYTIHPQNAAHYETLLAMLTKDQTLAGIIHLWSLDTEERLEQIDWMERAEHICGSTLHLLQSLLAHPTQSPTLWFVTENAQAVHPGDALTDLVQSALWGMGKVIAEEHPEYNCVCIDLDAADVDRADRLWQEIGVGFGAHATPEEFAEVAREAQVALRQDGRYVARLQPFAPTATNATPNGRFSCQPEATYLITGGLTGIGLATAAWLADQGATHLLLLGRRPPSAETEAILDGLRAEGVSVTVAQCDVTDYEQLQKVFERIDQANPLRGVIHAAGVLDDGVLTNQAWPRFDRVLRPKLQGAWHLHRLTQEMSLDFFVLYSSVAALLGNQGQANHAAANAFLDAFAYYRNAQKNDTVSINWGGWAEIGAAARLAQAESGKPIANRYALMTPAQGLAALGQILDHVTANPIAQVAVLPMRRQQFFQAATHRSSFLAEIADRFVVAGVDSVQQTSPAVNKIRQRLEDSPPEQRSDLLQTHLQEQVAATLGLSSPTATKNGVPIHTALTEMGLDSLMALELRRRLERMLDLSLSSTLIFTYPTIESLQTFLLAKLFPPVEHGAEDRQQLDEDAGTTAAEMFVPDESPKHGTTDELMAQIAARFASLD
ncbi:MAG: type I polyketide synthase [Caldilineaceae bacterium]